jgi:hypothetical protein
VLAALKAAARAHIEAKRGGADESRCKEAAETAYNRQLGDLGAYGSSVKDMPLIDAFRAARLARNEARDQGLPEDEQSRRAHQAFKAIMAAAEEQRATGPPT